ncbi:hypothetical protein L1987_20376 [Smallanthus sonchifolius]|uniref:Uncharacterized protein n=1 Tax=Smallanthus sonchifolius TaxID=185202 RepID=A0ACB9IS36_9ASTR|nr:hypothetical protein L1987_20376 [Smallanthus sonchifolius]
MPPRRAPAANTNTDIAAILAQLVTQLTQANSATNGNNSGNGSSSSGNGGNGGNGGNNPSQCTFKHFNSCNPPKFYGTEGATGLLQCVEEPDQSDVPSPTTTIKEEDNDNIFKTSTTETHGEGVSLETPLTERNPKRQETTGDGDAEARPTAPSGSKDSTTVDEDRLKLHNLELTARVAMLEAEVSKLRHQVSMHEAHQCPTLSTPSLVSVGTQTDAYLCTDPTKKGEMVSMEEDKDSLDDWIQEQVVLQSSLFKPAFVQIHDLPVPDNEDEETSEDWKLVVRAVDEMLNDVEDIEQTNTSFSLLPEAAAIIAERFWIGWEFSGVEELNWNSLNALQVLQLYVSNCINNSADLSAELAIGRFYDLMEDNLPHFERLIQKAKRVAYPESSAAAERKLTPSNLEITRSSLLNVEEVLGLRRFLYAFLVKDLDVLGWVSTKSLDHTLLLSNGSSLIINTRNILQLPSDFLFKIFQLRANICNINSLESQAMMVTIKAHLEKEGLIPQEESVSTSDTDSNSDTPQVEATSVAAGTRSSLRDQLRELEGPEYQLDEENDRPLSIPQFANEAEAEILLAASSSVVVISEGEAESPNVNKGKGIMTDEDEERLLKEKREREEKRRRREEEEMADMKKAQERKTAILLREQTIQQYAKQLDELKRKTPAVDRIEEDAALALQLKEQFNREEEELEKMKKEEAKFRITDSELAKEIREEWIKTLVSQGEDADYLEKLSTKEVYRAFMGQQGQLAKKKKAKEEEKAKQQSKKTIAFNKWTHEERKVMIDFLKARGDSGKRLGPMNSHEPTSPLLQIHHPSTLLPKPSTPPPNKSKSSHLAPTHQQPPLKKSKSSSEPEDSRNIVEWVYNPQDQRFEIFRGRTERRRSTYRSVDEVLQLPDSDLRRILEQGEAHEPAYKRGKHIMLAIRHYFNPSKDVVVDVKPLKSHSPFVSWSYNADLDEFTLIDVKKQQMRCSSKAIYKMPHKDIKTLSELPLNNPSKDPRGYEVERIVSHMQKLQQQSN